MAPLLAPGPRLPARASVRLRLHHHRDAGCARRQEARQAQDARAADDEQVVEPGFADDGPHRRRQHEELARPSRPVRRHAHDPDAVQRVLGRPRRKARSASPRWLHRRPRRGQPRAAAGGSLRPPGRGERLRAGRGRGSTRGRRLRRRFRPGSPLLDHVDGLSLALVPGPHQELAHEPEADEDDPGQEEQRAEEQERAPADRLVEEHLENGQVAEHGGAAPPEREAHQPEEVGGRVP